METVRGLTLATTEVDAHGEQCDKQFLLDLVASMPTRLPLNQHHDVGRPTVGYMENLRVEPHGPGWALKVDVAFDGSPPSSGGLSFSTTRILLPAEEPTFSLFVPYPYYNDQTLLTGLAGDNRDTSIGKWIKKSITPGDISLIVSIISLFISPAWKKTYDERVHPRLADLAASAKAALQGKNAGRTVRVDYLQPVSIAEYGGHIELYFIPTEHADTALAYGFAVREAIGGGMDLVKADWERSHQPIRRIVYVFQPDACLYRPTQIIYVDGDTRAI
jgi:hypothetical protein